MAQQSELLFFLNVIFYLIWGRVVFKIGIKKIYFFYFFFNVIIFLGPLLYYKIGFYNYSRVLTYDSLTRFSEIALTIVLLNLITYPFITRNNNSYLEKRILKLYSGEKKSNLLKKYYLGIVIIVTVYLILFFNKLPLVQLFTLGELGERLDVTGAIPFYFTFSSISMIFMPSAFLYLVLHYKKWYINLYLLLLTIFSLTAGGNKGIVSFFLFYYLIIFSRKINFFKSFVILFFLMFIYAATKGRLDLTSENIAYLVESPFRRLFVGQGIGFIGRIYMEQANTLNLSSPYLIKQQVFSEIFNLPQGSGTSPTHFLGNILVEYGYLVMVLIYLIYVYIIVKMISTLDNVIEGKKYAYILWNFFIIIFLTNMVDFTLGGTLRFIFIGINLYVINVFRRIKTT